MAETKEIELDKQIQENLEQVRYVIRDTNLPTTKPSRAERILGKSENPNLYEQIISELSEGTRNTPDQLNFLNAYETALSVFRTVALELRKEMDIITLEQRLNAQERAVQDKILRNLGTTAGLGSVEEVEASLARLEESDGTSMLDDDSSTITYLGKPSDDEIEARQTEAKKTQANEAEAVSLQKQITDAIFFSNRYALYFAGKVGLELLGEEKADVESILQFGSRLEGSKKRDELIAYLIKDTIISLGDIIGDKKAAPTVTTNGKEETNKDDDLSYTLKATFTSWINQFNWPTWDEIAAEYGVEDLKMKFGNYSMLAGEFKKKSDIVIVDQKFMPVRKEAVIGGQEFGQTLWKSMVKLGFYNHEEQDNEADPPFVIFTYGDPGCGKTYNAHAYIRSFVDLCKDKGIPVWALTHSTTDYASHFQNKTANELSSLAGRINDFPGIVMMYVADADNIFTSRKSPGITSEQQNTLGVYFKMFDGTLIPKNGKMMTIMDANYIDGIDDATKSRLFDEIIKLERFDQASQFEELARRMLSYKTASPGLTDGEWSQVGQYLLDGPLSIREITHVTRGLRGGFEPDEALLGTPGASAIIRAQKSDHLIQVGYDQVLGGFDHYITTRMEMERAAKEAKEAKDHERFMTSLNIEHKPSTA
ncbi:AAA family ATPase [Candidatus Woesearchaeota archaeon]|nr:AAA family ATPase [Candidatus Woesearchaeota archaeon]MBT6040741.1 AAA family ATPase [Candidatus Woesearchaeota archaeon]MBT6337462.1 AAA family ATPase [Candidatus Woesearchaeota archaeon]MBT7927988.1 AAA family ATPase [Candidatus Woesearchaeota archaeon]